MVDGEPVAKLLLPFDTEMKRPQEITQDLATMALGCDGFQTARLAGLIVLMAKTMP